MAFAAHAVVREGPRHSLRRGFVWTISGNVTFAAGQWLLLASMAKLGSPEMLGRYALALAIANPITALTNLQLREIQATDAARQYGASDYLKVRAVGVVVAIVSTVLLAVAAHVTWRTLCVVGAVALMRAADAVGDILYGMYQQREQMDRVALSMMAKTCLAVAVAAGLLRVTGSEALAVIGVACVYLLVVLTLDYPALRPQLGAPGARSAASLRRLAASALPMGVVMLILTLYASVPRYFLEHHGGTAELGVFAALAYLLVPATTIGTALGTAAAPRLARHVASRDPEAFRGLLYRLVLAGIAIGAVLVMILTGLGPWLVGLLYTEEYVREGPLFLMLGAAGAAAVVGAFLGTAVTTLRWFRGQLFVHLGAVGLLVGVAALLVPAHGMAGAAGAMMIAQTAALLGFLFLTVRHPFVRAPGAAEER